MSEDVYTRLREFMDKLPVGYPETPTGVEIKILKKLWTPDEAELTMKLKNEPEEISVIAKRVGMDEAELAEKLEAMAQKGIIYRVRSGDKKLYQAFQFVVGVYEFQLKNLDKEFCELFEEYLPYIGMNMMACQYPTDAGCTGGVCGGYGQGCCAVQPDPGCGQATEGLFRAALHLPEGAGPSGQQV